jgi:hypothetical protein
MNISWVVSARNNSGQSVAYGPFKSRSDAATWANANANNADFDGPFSSWTAKPVYDPDGAEMKPNFFERMRNLREITKVAS